MAYNNAYVEGRWGLFRHAGATRLITRKASLEGIDLPASQGVGTRPTMLHTTGSRTSPFGYGPSGQCRRSRRPQCQSPRKSAGEQNICSLCRLQTPPCP